MGLSQNTILVLLLGIFLVFVLSLNVKKRYEAMTNEKDPLEQEGDGSEKSGAAETEDNGGALGQRVTAQRKLAKNPAPDFMANPVKKVEPFSNPGSYECKGLNGTTYSAFGCCADGSAMTDASGTSCVGVAGCSYGKCPGTNTCRTSLSDPCSSRPISGKYTCNGFKGKEVSAYGCCANGTAMTDASGTNCAAFVECMYGKCPNGTSCKTSWTDNCATPSPTPTTPSITCAGASGTTTSVYGCCSNGTPMTDATGTNCAGFSVCNYGVCPGTNTCKTSLTDTCAAPTPTNTSITCVGASGTTTSVYGCCSNGTPMTDATGTNCAGFAVCNYGVCPGTNTCKTSLTDSCAASANNVITCAGVSGTTTSVYGCCSDGTPMSNATGTNCAGLAVCNYGVCPGTTTCKTSLTDSCASVVSSSTLTPSDPSNMYAGVTPQNTNTVFIPPPSGMLSSQPASVNSQSSTQDSSGNSMMSSSTSSSLSSSTSSTSNQPVQPPPTDPPVPAMCPAPEPCPPCGRCPEAAFDCKKVPNYDRTDNKRFVPQAVLSDFSSFGM